MSKIANTPQPPYYAVIFTSIRTEEANGYDAMAEKMLALAADQPGFLGAESAREGVGITISYWADLEAIQQWKNHAEHLIAQKLGREKWYASFTTRIARVERDYSWVEKI
ncbi:JEMB protein [Nitrincola sp. A-D6]|uniref:antibiotic biosynthesis monooxygenase family protein n=1 Tax=Nitrincola sp. A-D6 TaxID=1545442 RepID=UPI00051FD6E6|nr:antibiotic biosynthesis monooxygenase [Nitrincola sp. A-D6]KGK41225.1 JEMB protein [Nitrincola sp. A-D6]